MTQAAPLIWLFAGASLIAVVTQVTLAIGNRGLLPVPGPAYFAIVAGYSTTFALPFIVDRIGAPRVGGLGWTLIFPMAFVAAEFLQSRFAASATWGSIAYTQYGNLPLMQLAAFVGIWGITFMTAWFASTFEWTWSHGFEWSAVHTPALTYLAVLATILIGGTVRLVLAPTDRATMRVATLHRPVDLFVPGEMTRIAEGRVSSDARERLAGKLIRLHDWFLEGSRREARAGAGSQHHEGRRSARTDRSDTRWADGDCYLLRRGFP